MDLLGAFQKLLTMAKKLLIGLASILAIVVMLVLSVPFLTPKFEKNTVTFLEAKKTFQVEIADTPAKRTLGLMNRESLPEDSGMLFIFEDESEKSFWMKNTLIPLDMIFVDSKFEIVHIQKKAEPCKTITCTSYPSVKPAKYVVEINGGLSEKLGIEERQKVQINL